MGRLFAPKLKAVEAPVEAAAPASAGLTKDEIKELVTGAVAGVAGQLTQTVSDLGAKVQELAGRQPQVIVQPAGVAAPVVARGVTDEEIDHAVLSGQGAAQRIRQLVDRAVTTATEKVINEHIKPLQDFGVSTIGELSRRVTVGGMKYFEKYRPEIEQRLNSLDPTVRANPAVLEMVYNAVLGMHTDDLVREAGEAAVRKSQEQVTEQAPQKTGRTASPGTGAGGGNRSNDDEIPDVGAFAGDDGLAALSHKGSGGQDKDQFARNMGYDNWNDYMKQYNDLLKGETKGNA